MPLFSVGTETIDLACYTLAPSPVCQPLRSWPVDVTNPQTSAVLDIRLEFVVNTRFSNQVVKSSVKQNILEVFSANKRATGDVLFISHGLRSSMSRYHAISTEYVTGETWMLLLRRSNLSSTFHKSRRCTILGGGCIQVVLTFSIRPKLHFLIQLAQCRTIQYQIKHYHCLYIMVSLHI